MLLVVSQYLYMTCVDLNELDCTNQCSNPGVTQYFDSRLLICML